jgi:hypothetical protein
MWPPLASKRPLSVYHLRIGELRRSKQSTGFFLCSFSCAVVVVSAVANIAEGFTAVQGERLTTQTIRQLDPIQAFIGLAATGLVSSHRSGLGRNHWHGCGNGRSTSRTRQAKTQPRSNRQTAQVHTNCGHSTTSRQCSANTAETDSIERARAAKAEKDANSKTEAVNALLLLRE